MGIITDQHLSWQDHIAQLAIKLSHDIASLLCVPLYLLKSVLLTLYNAYFVSHLSYAIEFRSNASSSLLQKIRVLQKRAVRIIAHANYYAHAFPNANELGIFLLNDFIIYT